MSSAAPTMAQLPNLAKAQDRSETFGGGDLVTTTISTPATGRRTMGGGGVAQGTVPVVAVTDDADAYAPNESQLSQDLATFLANPSLRAALADGSLDLASYSGQVEDELQSLEAACISVYRKKSSDISSLAGELSECQTVLAALHEMLLGFQADLGGLSGEIRSLQEKSMMLDVQLKNRKAAELGLRIFLQRIVLAPNLVGAITSGPVNPVFLRSVQELNRIYKDAHCDEARDWSCDVAPSTTAAGREMQEQVNKLRLVAVTRVREYLLQQISLLRKPQTNVRMIQVHGLLKYAPLQDFLEDACPTVAGEILNVYCESMSKTLMVLFRTYQAQLLQLDATKSAATRHDVIAIDDALLRDSLTTRAKKRVDVFCLGRRAADSLALDEGSASPSSSQQLHRPILAHVALAENRRYPYERLFRSLLGHLVDAVTNEHVFCRQFFKRDAFGPLFHGTLSLLLEQLENYLFGCYDALCLLLMIKVTHFHRRVAHHRKIHSLDPFLDKVTSLLWPQLKTVMEGHLRSLRQATPQKLGGVDLHPHYVSRRFGEFCCSILLILHSDSGHRGGGHPTHNTGGGTTASTPPRRESFHHSSGAGGSRRALGPQGPKPPPTVGRTTSGPSDPAPTSMIPSTSQGTPTENASSPNRGGGDANAGASRVRLGSHSSIETAGDKLLEDLATFITEYVNLLTRLSERHTTQKKRMVFMINNLDQIVCIFQERRVVGREFNRFVELLMTQRELFVEEELLHGFSRMIAFVQQTESYLAGLPQGTSTYEEVNSQVVESLVVDFASHWKLNMDLINRDVLSYFSNFRNGMEILKQVLTQLLLYYTRFQEIIRKVWKNKPPAFCQELVSTTMILNEIKKYALAI
eukprot:Pompholyxophrys_punicea_v1_NODE_6_length_8794_cov_7.233894.p1 type:complete len:864 gc:universal NODE_6_length_8794_cov_7.233894:8122-5531(-)